MTEGVFLADNLDVLRDLPDSCLDLVYIDPPFGTNQVRRLDAIKTGAGEKARNGFAGRQYAFEVVSSHRYRDNLALDEYLGFMYARLAEIHRALRPAGSLYLHLDFHAAHYGRLLLDELFGRAVPQRSHLGVRLRRARPGPLAEKARQHPLVREIGQLDVQHRRHRPHPLHGPGPGPPGKSCSRQTPHGYVVAHDRAYQRLRTDRVPNAEAVEVAGTGNQGVQQPRGPGRRLFLRERDDWRGR